MGVEEKSCFGGTKIDLYSMFVGPFIQRKHWDHLGRSNGAGSNTEYNHAQVHCGVCSESVPLKDLSPFA